MLVSQQPRNLKLSGKGGCTVTCRMRFRVIARRVQETKRDTRIATTSDGQQVQCDGHFIGCGETDWFATRAWGWCHGFPQSKTQSALKRHDLVVEADEARSSNTAALLDRAAESDAAAESVVDESPLVTAAWDRFAALPKLRAACDELFATQRRGEAPEISDMDLEEFIASGLFFHPEEPDVLTCVHCKRPSRRGGGRLKLQTCGSITYHFRALAALTTSTASGARLF